MKRPKLLDLFCCAGGAATGYHQAGFDVVGVDISPQPNYPFEFIQGDVMEIAHRRTFLSEFHAIHASPPCQSYSVTAKRTGNGTAWPRLVKPVRDMLRRTGKPYVIENVVGAPMQNAIMLCGTMFPNLRVIRHRLFESNVLIMTPPHGTHPICHTLDRRKSHYGKTDEWKDFVQVMGGGNCSVAAAREAMGIDWMSKAELNEAIPPAYALHVGKALIRHMKGLNGG